MAIRGEGIQLGPWMRGVDYSRPAEDLEPEWLASMRNCRIGPAGEVSKRLGSASYESLAALAGAPSVMMAAEFDLSATTTRIVIAADTEIYRYTGTAWSALTGEVSITPGYAHKWVNANGTLVACNGVDEPWKWTGSTADTATYLNVNDRFSTPKHLAYWDNRVWVGGEYSNPDRVWYSDPGETESWGAYSFYNLGARVTGLAPANQYLALHTTEGIHVIKPNEATTGSGLPYRLEKLGELGGLDGRSVATLSGDRQLYLTREGIFRWDGQEQVEKVSYALDVNYWPELNADRLVYAFAQYVPRLNEVWFFLPYGSAQQQMNHVMIYNEYVEEESSHYRWYGPYTGWTRYCSTLIGGKVHTGGAGILWDSETGDADVAAGIQGAFVTSAPSPHSGSNLQRWLFARTFFDPLGPHDLLLTQVSAGIVGTSTLLRMTGSGFILDEDRLDEGRLGSDRAVYRDTPLNGYDPHMALQFANGSPDEPFTIRRVHLHHRDLRIKRRRKPGVN